MRSSTQKRRKKERQEDWPLFSVCVVTYNQRHLLEDCIDSVLMQAYPNIELVICDDESCDFEIDSVRAYIEANKDENISSVIIYKHQRNVGTTLNCMKAIELSHGSLFKLQAGDDMLYDEDVLLDIAKEFAQPGTNIICTRAQACSYEGKPLESVYPMNGYFEKAKNATPHDRFRYIGSEPWGMYVCAPAVFWRRSFYEQMGKFDPSYKFTEDWPMWLRICEKGLEMTYIERIAMYYRMGGISTSQSEWVNAMGKDHYVECIRMLDEIARPVFKKNKDWHALFRCWYSRKSLELRIISESIWKELGFFQRFKLLLRYAYFFIIIHTYHLIDVKKMFSLKKPLFFIFAVSVLLYYHIPLHGSWNNEWLYSMGLIAMSAVASVMILWNLGTTILKEIVLMLKKRM